jgi:hypothetical protein
MAVFMFYIGMFSIVFGIVAGIADLIEYLTR